MSKGKNLINQKKKEGGMSYGGILGGEVELKETFFL